MGPCRHKSILIGGIVYSVGDTVGSCEFVEPFDSDSFFSIVNFFQPSGFLRKDFILSFVEVVVPVRYDIVIVPNQTEFVFIIARVGRSVGTACGVLAGGVFGDRSVNNSVAAKAASRTLVAAAKGGQSTTS